MLFNIYIRDVFPVANDTNIANYADDIKPYIGHNNISTIIVSLERSGNLMFNSLTDSQIKGRKDKCHALFSTVKTLQINLEMVLHL